MLDVRLAGGLAVAADGEELPAPASRRARSLLAYLALRPGPQSRAQLAARFWPEVLDESARASLRVALTELRQALGAAASHLVATRDTVALEGADLRVDTRAFDEALARGDVTAALAACSGEILDGFEDEWALDARRQHAERLAEALEHAAASTDDPLEAIRLTRAQVTLDPLAEAANRRLIERLAAAGDRAAALAAGRQFTERLRAQLGIPPSPETRALIDALRRPEVPPIPPPAAVTRAHDTQFVGRHAELDRLRASWGGVQMHSDRRVVLVAGEPGVGKTRLVGHFASAALDEGATVLLGRCSEEPLAPFEPFAEGLRQAGAAEALRPGDSEDAGARHRLFDTVDATLSQIASRAPLLLVLDDLQWADPGTLLLLTFLVRSPRPGPLLVLGVYRDTDLGRRSPLTAALAVLQRDGALDRVRLRGLAQEDVAALARSLLGSDDVAARVYARTDGNAFFVEEVLRGLAESDAPDVPESVRQAVGARLSGLSEEANELLAAAAVLGLEHDARVLEATAAIAPSVAEQAVDEVLRAHLLRPAAAPQHFEFAHALVRETVLDEINVLRRARLHRRAAEALSALGEERHLEEIAMHLFEAASAGDAREAAAMLERAGRRAFERLAYEDAAERFGRALEALSLAGGEDEAGPLLLARGHALLRAGDVDEARAAFSSARALARRTGDPSLVAEAALGFAGLGIAIIDVDQATVARLEEALELVEDDALRSRLLARLAVELYYAPDRTRSELLSSSAVDAARASRDESAVASALGARHVALWRPDRLDERLAAADEMIAAARAAGERHTELQARNWRVSDLFELGDMVACRAEMARHGELAQELRLPAFEWYTPLWAGLLATLAGRFEEAEPLLAEAEQAGGRAGDRNAELFAEMIRFCGQMSREAFDEIEMAFLEDKIANSPAGPAYRGSYSWILAGLGETARAQEMLATAMSEPQAFDANWISFQVECSEASVLLGHATHAQTLYERLVPYAGRPATAGRAATSFGAVDRSLGGLAALLGRQDAAVQHLEDALRLDELTGCLIWREHAERRLRQLRPRAYSPSGCRAT
ncbi:MAG TPA: AAA family ATPase [Thermoleophilaceae bacterium]